MILLVHQSPWVWLKAFDAEANPFPFVVQMQYIHVNFVTHFHHFARMSYPMPGELGDMHQAIGASQVDKGPEMTQAGNDAPSNFTFAELVHKLFLLPLTPLASCRPLRKNQASATAVDLNNLQRQCLAYELRQLSHFLIMGEAARHIY